MAFPLPKFAILAVFLVLVPITSQAKTIRACMAAWSPYATTDDDGNIGGPHTEILRGMAEKLGYDLEIEELPWKRCLKMAERGEVDIVYSASFDERRAEYLHYPKQHLYDTHYIFVIKEGAEHSWDEKKDVTKLPQPIGAVNGFSVTQSLNEIEGLEIDDGASSDRCNLEKFVKGRVTTVIIEHNAFDKLSGDLATAHEILDPPFQEKRYYITLSRKAFGEEGHAKEFLQAMENHLSQLEKSGELGRLYKPVCSQ